MTSNILLMGFFLSYRIFKAFPYEYSIDQIIVNNNITQLGSNIVVQTWQSIFV